jgi:hypothetical protein
MIKFCILHYEVHIVQIGYGAHPSSYPMGTGCSFPGVKRPGRKAYCPLQSSAEVVARASVIERRGTFSFIREYALSNEVCH